jgi:hypothetical protein
MVARRAACLGVLAVEVIGTLAMWAPIPLAWIWIGSKVYDLTGSLAADGLAALIGFGVTIVLVMRALARLDVVWIGLRRETGHLQKEGALTQVVVISATFGLIAFLVWYYVLEDAYILPFMPSQ